MRFDPTKLKAIRKARRLTQENLAELAGISQASIARYERGEQVPSTDNFERLADALGVTALDLVSGFVRSEVEREILEALRHMSPEEQRAMLAFARSLMETKRPADA